MQKILIVEDETSSAELLSFVLEQEGYVVAVAANGAEALSALGSQNFDLVLCDLMMPVMDGRELCRAMKTDPQFVNIPIVIMSAAPEISFSHLSDEGCVYTSYMRKPLDLDLLIATVRNLIATRN